MQNWKNIWGERGIDSNHESTLDQLIAADGFDTGFGTIKKDDWVSYVKYIIDKLVIKHSDSIFEVGCGSGAFLHNFYISGHKVGGIDYSENLIDIANKYLEKGSFECNESLNIDDNIKYDIVLSNAVFFYFPSLEYSQKVLEKMISKAHKSIAILDVSDNEHREKSLKIRKGNISEEEYDKRYEGLDHLYYEKQWFKDISEKYNLKVEIEQQNIRNYKNNAYRFNVFLYK